MSPFRVVQVGAGGVGRKRAAAAQAHAATELVAVCDRNETAAADLASEFGVTPIADWGEALAIDADLIVVSTTHEVLSSISTAALQAGRHVLCEKPLGRNVAEVRSAVQAAQASGRVLHAGYNHRFHPAILAARAAVDNGEVGPLLNIRGRYGHGGRPGYDREWRADPDMAGGGELLDQGAHLIDLSLWLLDPVESVQATTQTAFWDMSVEDNAFVLLRTTSDQVASLHVSWTQWRNLFSLELCGRDGYITVDGLGGSYGTEQLVLGRRPAVGGVPEEKRQVFDRPDDSWNREWDAFVNAVDGRSGAGADASDALSTMEWIARSYRAASTGQVVDRGHKPWENKQ